MMRDKGTGRCTTVEWLQDRRLDLIKGMIFQIMANSGYRATSGNKDLFNLITIRDQVQVAFALAQLFIFQAMILLWE